MKILVVLTYYYPHWTGLTAYAQRLAEGMTQRGHQVTVLTSQHNPQLAREEVYNGVKIIRLPYLLRLSRGVVMPAFPLTAWRLLLEHDVVQIHTPLLESWLVTWLAARASKGSLITHHGDLVMPTGFFNQFVQKIVVWLMIQAERRASAISVHSRDYAEHSSFLWPFHQKLSCIYPPVEIPRPNQETVLSWRRELGLADKKVIGFAGRFVEEKGFDFLLKAIPRVLAQVPNAVFAYAGERFVAYEKFYQRWEPLVKANQEHLVFMGLIHDHQKLADFYAMCDVFALPSRTDCFPSVQIEAMLCGTPVVATDIPGAGEVIKVVGNGKLVRPQDEEALAEGLVQVLQDPARYVQPYDTIRTVFNTLKSLDEYEALLGRLAGKRLS